jgi:hypothetical protein
MLPGHIGRTTDYEIQEGWAVTTVSYKLERRFDTAQICHVIKRLFCSDEPIVSWKDLSPILFLYLRA